MLDAYNVLKDMRKRKEYDLGLKSQGGFGGGRSATARYRQSEWHNRYYGEAKYYSRGGGGSGYTASGYNTKRHRVRFDHGHVPQEDSPTSGFHGKHRNYGDRYDVSHFDYDEHLNRNLKFEQRLIDKRIDSETKEKILAQLEKSGRVITEEVKTKHLLRQAQLHTSIKPKTEYMSYPSSNPYQYQSRQQPNDTFLPRSFMYMVGGGGLSMYLLYKIVA
ncbi:hypothetical protein JA1_002897 [Spathaspora sp. JA1]|nr:hypothetical protein JA1_002897 [Spathaspora sp. JA1]